MNNILCVNKENCFGCGACVNKCKVNAIKMEYDKEGFLYPVIDTDKCIECGLCYKSCPAINEVKKNKKIESYAVWADDDIRANSSSGGMFSLVANYILDKGGYVCGAAFSDDYMSVEHIIINSKADLYKLQGSKYVQTDTSKVFKKIEELLKKDKYVLFSGCPCQVAGLCSYLGKNYEKLYTIDLICTGPSSQKVYQTFLKEIVDVEKIKKVDFRNKAVLGWNCSALTVQLIDDKIVKDKWYHYAFIRGIINRNSCFDCIYATKHRVSDMTVGDYWGIDLYNKKLNDKKGTSAVMIHTKKMKKIFKEIKSNMKLCKRTTYKSMYRKNLMLVCSRPKNPRRDDFFLLFENIGYHAAINKIVNNKYDVALLGLWDVKEYGKLYSYYALNEFINSLGYRVLFVQSKRNLCTELLMDFGLDKNFNYSNIYSDDGLISLNNACDIFLCDEVNIFDKNNCEILSFVFNNKKKVAIGQTFYNGEKTKCKQVFQSFDGICVADQKSVNNIKDIYNDVKYTLDPLFFIDKAKYEKLVEKIEFKTKSSYLLSCMNVTDLAYEKNVSKIAKSMKINIKYNINIGAKDAKTWLANILNSSYVVCDSYYTLCLAIIFKKDFVVVMNNNDTKIVDLLDNLCLSDRVVTDVAELETNHILKESIDYKSVYKKLEYMRMESIEWLKNILLKPNEKFMTQYDHIKYKQYNLLLQLNKMKKQYDENTLKKDKLIFNEANIAKFKKTVKKEGLKYAVVRATDRIKYILKRRK